MLLRIMDKRRKGKSSFMEKLDGGKKILEGK